MGMVLFFLPLPFVSGFPPSLTSQVTQYPEIAKAVERKEVLLEWNQKKNGPPPVPLLKDVFASERRFEVSG